MTKQICNLESRFQRSEPGEVALQQFVVIDGLGDDPADKLEVAQVVRVNVAEVVDCVGHLTRKLM